ncbi:SPOR domain-containing protein [Paracoccus sanguinis]|uniref:SPOR domain-containing protein n=1 Tax=Paracoccus sanguinis TaxID=1545044 RepID=A0A099GBQ8_9RHOB|nr:SPOR domain-containing protein [Paracoccus sanguinis]KGJ20194.1 hypothetical protein IX56_14520 [Paracoccus sanguinis]
MRITGFSALAAVAALALLALPPPVHAAGGAHDAAPAAAPAASAHGSAQPAPDRVLTVPEGPLRTPDIPAEELADRAPAEAPPPGFTAAQYIDSQGCVFVRTGAGWAARIARDGSAICGYPPTLSARRTDPDRPPTLFAPPEEPRAQRIERVLTETIVSNLIEGELLIPPAAPHAPAASASGDAPSAGAVNSPPPAAPVATDPKGSPENGGPLAARTAGPAKPADPLGLSALVREASVATVPDPSRRHARLCALTGADATPQPGLGGATALGFCGPASVSLSPQARPETPAPGRARIATAASAPPLATRGASPTRAAATPKAPRQPAPTSARAATERRTTTAVRQGTEPMIPPGARYVQIGAFRDAGNAARTARRVSDLGLPVARSLQGQTQLIMVGPLTGREAVVRALDRVRRAGFRDAYARR